MKNQRACNIIKFCCIISYKCLFLEVCFIHFKFVGTVFVSGSLFECGLVGNGQQRHSKELLGILAIDGVELGRGLLDVARPLSELLHATVDVVARIPLKTREMLNNLLHLLLLLWYTV
jgi:hypothetical protein